MKTVKINGKTLQMYDGIDELPVVNFQKYNKYILLDSGIGSDADAIDAHLVQLARLIKSDLKKATRELQNMRLNMRMVVCEISPLYMAFTALIHSIDGERLTDLSDDNLKRIFEELNKEKHSKIVEFLLGFKKKLDEELRLYFPGLFSDTLEKTVFDKYIQRANLELAYILDDVDTMEEIKAIEDYLHSLYKPKSFDGKDSIEIKFDKQFETSCMLISQKTNRDAKAMTVLEYYTALENIQKQAEAEAKAYKKHR